MELKCSFCGRPVKPTIHSKKLPQGYVVDYYLVWTGKLTPMIMKNPRDERALLQFFRLDSSSPRIACVQCFEKEEVKKELDRAFAEVPKADLLEQE